MQHLLSKAVNLQLPKRLWNMHKLNNIFRIETCMGYNAKCSLSNSRKFDRFVWMADDEMRRGTAESHENCINHSSLNTEIWIEFKRF